MALQDRCGAWADLLDVLAPCLSSSRRLSLSLSLSLPFGRCAQQKEKATLRDVLAECYDLKNVKPELLKLLLTSSKDEKEKERLNSLLSEGVRVTVRRKAVQEDGAQGPQRWAHLTGSCWVVGCFGASGCVRRVWQSSVASNKTLSEYLYGREVVDILTEFRARPTLDLFLSHLGRLLPRYYSISSSQNVVRGPTSVCVG